MVFRILKKESVAEEVLQDVFLKIDGKPVDAGIFDRNTAGLIKMKEIGKGAIKFAVTIEPCGGKTSPTLETMQEAGDVAKGYWPVFPSISYRDKTSPNKSG